MANQPRDVVERLHSEKRREEHEMEKKNKQTSIDAIPLKSGRTLYMSWMYEEAPLWRKKTLKCSDVGRLIGLCMNVRCAIQNIHTHTVRGSPVVHLLRGEGPSYIQGMNFSHRDDWKKTNSVKHINTKRLKNNNSCSFLLVCISSTFLDQDLLKQVAATLHFCSHPVSSSTTFKENIQIHFR